MLHKRGGSTRQSCSRNDYITWQQADAAGARDQPRVACVYSVLQSSGCFQLSAQITSHVCCEQWYIAAYMHVVGCRNWSECISIMTWSGLRWWVHKHYATVLLSAQAICNNCAKTEAYAMYRVWGGFLVKMMCNNYIQQTVLQTPSHTWNSIRSMHTFSCRYL